MGKAFLFLHKSQERCAITARVYFQAGISGGRRDQGGDAVVHVEALLADPHRRSLTPEVATASRNMYPPRICGALIP